MRRVSSGVKVVLFLRQRSTILLAISESRKMVNKQDLGRWTGEKVIGGPIHFFGSLLVRTKALKSVLRINQGVRGHCVASIGGRSGSEGISVMDSTGIFIWASCAPMAFKASRKSRWKAAPDSPSPML